MSSGALDEKWKDAEMHDVNVLPTNGRDGMKRKCKKPTGSAEMDESCLKLSAGPTFVPSHRDDLIILSYLRFGSSYFTLRHHQDSSPIFFRGSAQFTTTAELPPTR
ncbi:uncharacterized protein LOC135163413 isoform X5 [Diachasmimorpha longicaudata]|uniref:uncharacterized protein LOC135163413 isoform X5 n=1 Tax=Diachasmimorpha longicaudata TaxID=58733 RepID=UPI0030B8EAA0